MGRSTVARRAWLSGLIAIAAVVFIGLGGCAQGPPPPLELETGPDAEATVDGLYRAKRSLYSTVFVKPDADFATYTEVMLDPIQIAYKRKPTSKRYGTGRSNFALTKNQTADLKRRLREALIEALDKSKHYKSVEEPGPHVLRLEAALIDLVVKVPTESYGRDRTYTTSAGEMTLVMELRDSLSNEILARIADRKDVRSAGVGMNDLYYSNAVTNTAAIRRIFNKWAQILVARLDSVHDVLPTAKLKEDAADAE